MSFGGARAAKDAASASVAGQQSAIDEQRSRFNSISEMLAPFINQGKDFLGATGAGATLGGFGQSLNDIMGSDIFQQLRGKRVDAINSAFGNKGMLNSGGRAAAIGDDMTDFGLALEEMLYGRQRDQQNMGLNATSGLAGFSNNTGNNISQLLSGQGESRASGILGAQQAKSALTGQLLQAAGPLLAMFSDERLKENIKPLYDLGPLTVYEWDWIPEVAHLNLPMKTGFLAQEVEAIFPKYVHQVGAFKAIDYDGLLKRLDQVIH